MEELPELNDNQAVAALAIKYWFEGSERQVFVLSGYAGTGKTFLVNYVIKNLLDIEPKKVAFVAPTGKAASVLIQRGQDASTIHRLIYQAVEDDEYSDTKKKRKIKFVKRPSIGNYKLIVVDEISMVEQKVLDDLLSYGIPVLCCGDKMQLPAIGTSNKLLDNPDIELTEIVRQSEDNAIVKIATLARKKLPIPFGNFGDVIVVQKDILTEEQKKKLFLKADQVLCGRNSTRNKINKLIRQYKGIDVEKNKFPLDGEKVICNVNNWDTFLDKDKNYNMVNGTIGYISNFKEVNVPLNIATFDFQADFLHGSTVEGVVGDSGYFKNGEYSYDMHQRAYKMPDDTYFLRKDISLLSKNDLRNKDIINELRTEFQKVQDAVEDEQIEQIDFGYCISVHKSQGSEWNNVVLIDESNIFGTDCYKHLYTGITRAKKKLVILK